MPQAVSIFSVAPSAPSRKSLATSNDDGPSKFDGVLDGARNPDSSQSTASNGTAEKGVSANSADSTKSTDKTSKSGKIKSANTTNTKAGPKATARKAANAEAETPPAEPDDLAATTAKEAETPETTDHSPDSKGKAVVHATHVAEQRPTAQPAIVPQSANVLKPAHEEPQGSADDGKDHPSKLQSPVEAVSAEDGANGEAGDHSADVVSTDSAGHVVGAATDKHGPELASGGAGPQGIQPSNGQAADSPSDNGSSVSAIAADTDIAAANSAASAVDVPSQDAAPAAGTNGNAAPHTAGSSFAEVLSSVQGPPATTAKSDTATVQSAAHVTAAPREAQFAEANHAQIVTGIQGQLLPNGGSMQIHLNPGELGSMSVSVHMRDGVMTATFDTSNDQAARLLTHSLGQLKTALESQGMSVGSLHVQQSPRGSPAGSDSGGKGSDSAPREQSPQQQQEQQRKDMLRRIWRRLNGGKDPLDLVA